MCYLPPRKPPTNFREREYPGHFVCHNSKIYNIMFNNFDFRTSTPKDTDFAEVHPLSTVAKALGCVEAKLANRGNGNFLLLVKADGTYTTMPASKEMKAEHLADARIGMLKDKDANGKSQYIAIRPDGVSSVVTATVRF